MFRLHRVIIKCGWGELFCEFINDIDLENNLINSLYNDLPYGFKDGLKLFLELSYGLFDTNTIVRKTITSGHRMP